MFGLGWSSDVKYSRKMIKVMNKAIGDNQDDLNEFINRTEIIFDQIKDFSESVVKLEWNIRDMNYSMRKMFVDVRHAQKATVLYQNLLPVVLVEELGWGIYLRDLLTRIHAFRNGVQYLLRGQLSMDLVPLGAIKQALGDVDAYLKTAYPRFRAAFSSLSFYYDSSKPISRQSADLLH